MEARQGDEIVLTISDLNMKETEDQPAPIQPHVERASSPKPQQETKGRRVHFV